VRKVGLDIRDVLRMRQARDPLLVANRHGAQAPKLRRLAEVEESALAPATRVARERERRKAASLYEIKFIPKSPAEKLAALPKAERDAILMDMGAEQAEALLHDWLFWARPEQLEPEGFAAGDYFIWMIMAGRGSGKTRTGAEVVRDRVEKMPKGHTEHRRIALVAETAADARDVMVEGESGLLAISDPKNMPIYLPSRRLVKWPCGCRGTTYSGEEPDQLRGPQHDFGWVDELAKYKYPEETMDNLELGMRLGDTPQMVITTTPRPIKIVRELMADKQVIVTTASSYSNIQNLAPSFINRVIKKYEGTRRGRQELHAELLDDVEGALWTRSRIEKNRVKFSPNLIRIVVAIDPSVSDDEDSDEIGIAVCGIAPARDGVMHGYFLDDLSGIYTVDQWAKKAVLAFDTYEADVVVGEVNNGGDLVAKVIHTVRSTLPFRKVWASRGKAVRAEPISALDEQGKIHHVGQFAELEDQLVAFTPDGYTGPGSPDRADAYVWGFTELMLQRQGDFDPKNYEVYSE
jgi:phage terminase large subunit-like protein